MRNIVLRQPSVINVGSGVFDEIADDFFVKKSQKILILAATPLILKAEHSAELLRESGKAVFIYEFDFPGEPTFTYFQSLLSVSESFSPDCIIGIGGGSVLDCAKLMSALTNSDQSVNEVTGINLLKGRSISVICVPTTSGTGSEVSPNAILLDENTSEKKGIISPFLVPDSCYIDAQMTLSLPARLTAETGIDALCHCIEAYTNINAHPAVDVYALKGIELIGASLIKAYKNGDDINARTAMALGSFYGGLCLGPVNTTAVHALSYGLGGKYHISHGLANAILLPEVMMFNLEKVTEKTARIAIAMGVMPEENAEKTALEGIKHIKQLCIECGIPQHLSELGIEEKYIEELASIAMNVKRLLVNNPKEMTHSDAVSIYRKLI
jgi:alcohol dehydrogenase